MRAKGVIGPGVDHRGEGQCFRHGTFFHPHGPTVPDRGRD
jgi:hypothetical protein